MVYNLSLEERIFKQIQDLSSSIIRALDSLEKELSEYIEVTDKRLHKLEDKIQKVESYVDASSKGLVGSIESTAPEKTLSLPQSHPREMAGTQDAAPHPTVTPTVTASVEQPKVTPPTTPQPTVTTPEKIIQSKEPISAPITSSIPPIPTPPSFKAVISEEEKREKQPSVTSEAPITTQPPITSLPPIPKTPEMQQPKTDAPQAPEAPQGEEGEKKEDDKDKNDLMSALKTIDSL